VRQQTETIKYYIGDPDVGTSNRLSQPVADLSKKISKSFKTSITCIEEALPSSNPSAHAKEEGILGDIEFIDLTFTQPPIKIDLTREEHSIEKLSKSQRRRLRSKIVKERHQLVGNHDNHQSSRLHHKSLKIQRAAQKTFQRGIQLAKEATSAGSVPSFTATSASSSSINTEIHNWLSAGDTANDLREKSRSELKRSGEQLQHSIRILDDCNRIGDKKNHRTSTSI